MNVSVIKGNTVTGVCMVIPRCMNCGRVLLCCDDRKMMYSSSLNCNIYIVYVMSVAVIRNDICVYDNPVLYY